MATGKTKKQDVQTILKNFKNNIFSVEYYFEKFGDLAAGEDREAIQKLKSYLKRLLEPIRAKRNANPESKEDIQLNEESLNALIKTFEKPPKISGQNFDILSKSAFLMLNNYFEYLLADLMSYHYEKFRDTLNEKKLQATLKEISEFDSMEDLVKYLITKEVEAMIVEMSFDDLREHFQKKLGIDNETKIINWNIIVECRERRHLIVHNSSIVNKKYISRTGNPFDFKVGDKINIKKDYFIKSCKEFFLAGIILSYNCWGKWDKDSASEAIQEIMQESFDLLKNEDYELVERFTQYLERLVPRNEDEEDSLLRTKFNRLIALKKNGKTNELQKEIKNIKVGTSSPVFKLAFAILTDKHDGIIDIAHQAKALGDIDIDKYRDWPIFSFIREEEELNAKFELLLADTSKAKETPTGEEKPQKTFKRKVIDQSQDRPEQSQ